MNNTGEGRRMGRPSKNPNQNNMASIEFHVPIVDAEQVKVRVFRLLPELTCVYR
jgi:hypothetical protein